MSKLTDKQKAEYFNRSYKAVDGFWFLKIEEEFGFKKALEFDEKVWKVFPKIQVRCLKEMLGLEEGLESLLECLKARLELEEFDFELIQENGDDKFEIKIKKCSWHEAMVRSGRESLSGKVGNCICVVENFVWAKEFGDDIEFELGPQLCEGNETCSLKFKKKK